MGSNTRHAPDHLERLDQAVRQLADELYRYDFFAAARLIEAASPDMPRLGRAIKATAEPVRFGHAPSLSFPPSSLNKVDPATDRRAMRVRVNYLGLLGPNGPLPLHLTEYEMERRAEEKRGEAKDDTSAFGRFLDIFNHRAMVLFYRAWAQAQPCVSFDRPQSDRFGDYVASIVGLGVPAMRHADAMPDLAKQHYAGLLASQAKGPDGLAAILRGLLRVPVAIREFVGQWLSIPSDQRCRLGSAREASTLGINTTLGPRVRDHQHKFSLRFGPLRLEQYTQLLPGSESIGQVHAVVRNYTGDQPAWDVQLVLRRNEVPDLRLGRQGRLGWTTWLPRVPGTRHPDDLRIDPAAKRVEAEPDTTLTSPPPDTVDRRHAELQQGALAR